MITRSHILCCGRWQPSGCQPSSGRPLGSRMPHPGLMGFASKILCLSLMPPALRTSRSWGKRGPWSWPGHYRTVLKNLGLQQASKWFHTRASEMYGPLMTLSRDDIVEASLLKPTGEEHGTCPRLEEEAALLGKEIKPPQVPRSLPEWPEISEFIEHTEQITTPSASSPSPMPQPGCLSSWKAMKSQ